MAGSGTSHLRRGRDDLILQVENLVMEFPVGTSGAKVHAVSDVSLDLAAGETLGLVGESGCGKSTTGKAIMRVPPPTSGKVLLEGTDLSTLDAEGLRDARGRLQMIFQDPISSLNPRRTIREVVAEPLTIRWLESFGRSPVSRAWEAYVPAMLRVWRHPLIRRIVMPAVVVFFAGLLLWVFGTAFGPGEGEEGVLPRAGNVAMVAAMVTLAPIAAIFAVTGAVWLVLSFLMPFAAIPRLVKIRRDRQRFWSETDEHVRRVLNEVGIDPDAAMDRRPHEFSGGQAQRISIARALILDPKVIICDEPVSALDVSVQAQVLNLLEDLKAKYGISLMFIAHDLAVVKNISDRLAVMYLGKICEVGHPDELYARPKHPYTSILMSSIPVPDPLLDPRSAEVISGELPSPIFPPSGCRFRTRCPRAGEICADAEPVIEDQGNAHYVACHFPLRDDETDASPSDDRATSSV
jgi:oligopeptide/dipeptide ABC transporter ATP-binding protein